ncbi:MAG: protein phosphatase 2C domain-containing protein [Zoogloeaceae bacterium]|jgi:serine/threonine protein phosphatase PrpC|nr:protein phosphatase 2C domain-containing protein [Zoogloeaceae bacterium]
MRFTIYQESRQGGRKNNEDRVAHCYSREALLMIVADGMGGHHYGEVAAQIAVQTLIHAFQREARPALADPFSFLQQNIDTAHCAILDYTRQHKLNDSPRTTLVACVVQNNLAYWAHAGDSRLYLVRRGRVIRQTRDHSKVRYLLDEGLISLAQAKQHPERNKIYSCLGGPLMPEVAYSRKTPLEIDDLLILCTDGLWSQAPDNVLVQAFASPHLTEAGRSFMRYAERQGGVSGDNLSLAVVRWEEDYAPPEMLEGVSTRYMGTAEVASTLTDFGRDPQYTSDLSDEEIEAAIAEIHAAIEKYTPPK